MITGEVFAGEDAEILFQAVSSDYGSDYTSEIQDLTVNLKSYKQASEVVLDASTVYDSTMQQHILTIPASHIPASGVFDWILTGTGIVTVVGRAQVNVADGLLTTISTSIPTTSEIASAILAASIRSGRTVSQVLRIIEIMLAGSDSGLTSGTGSPVTFTGADNSTIEFTVDSNGNRGTPTITLV